jgi:hypothetical protein
MHTPTYHITTHMLSFLKFDLFSQLWFNYQFDNVKHKSNLVRLIIEVGPETDKSQTLALEKIFLFEDQ